MIELSHVSFGYGTETTVSDVSLTIQKGELTAVIGANGAGKSTLGKLIRGLIRPTSGTIMIDGEPLAKQKPSSLAGKIGFLFQNPDRQLCKRTIREELQFSLKAAGVPKEEQEALCGGMLDRFGFSGEENPLCMSRGERQRVALASVLVGKPELLILDEPTTGLDYAECIHIMDTVRELNQQGVTVLMVCHDMELVLDYSTRIIVMNAGRLVAEGRTKDVFFRPEVLQQAALLPPQIIGLSLMLDGQLGCPCTAEEMADAALLLAEGGESA